MWSSDNSSGSHIKKNLKKPIMSHRKLWEWSKCGLQGHPDFALGEGNSSPTPTLAGKSPPVREKTWWSAIPWGWTQAWLSNHFYFAFFVEMESPSSPPGVLAWKSQGRRSLVDALHPYRSPEVGWQTTTSSNSRLCTEALQTSPEYSQKTGVQKLQPNTFALIEEAH